MGMWIQSDPICQIWKLKGKKKSWSERAELVGRKLKNEISCKFENGGGIAVGIGSNFKENKQIKRK